MQALIKFAALVLLAVTAAAQEIPAGTALPIMLNTTLDTAKAKPGQKIAAKLMERVQLPSGAILAAGAKVTGEVVESLRPRSTSVSHLVIRFDRLQANNREYRFMAGVRALASMMAVFDAQVPVFEPDRVSRSMWKLAPVGGLPNRGEMMAPNSPAGKPSWAAGDAGGDCGGYVDYSNWGETMWVFSPRACGTYGFGKGIVIARSGSGEPKGEIELQSRSDVNVHSGSGFLLVVGGSAPQNRASTSE